MSNNWAKWDAEHPYVKKTFSVPIDEVKRYRGHGLYKSTDKLEEDIRKNGVTHPISMTFMHDHKTGEQQPFFIDGHHRLAAAERAGLTHVPVTMFAPGQKGYDLADKQATEDTISSFDFHTPNWRKERAEQEALAAQRETERPAREAAERAKQYAWLMDAAARLRKEGNADLAAQAEAEAKALEEQGLTAAAGDYYETPSPTEVDGSDEADHDAAEQALGLALGALLLAELLPGPASFLSGIKGWNDRVEAVIGPSLQAFLQRSALDIAAESEQPGASATALEQAAQSYPGVLAWVQDKSHETLQNLTDDHVDDTNTAQAALSAAEGLARGAAVYAKSEVRQQTAGELGAVWKVWRTRHDPRVRTTHQELEGQKVPYDGTFHVDGIPIRYPGDPLAPIELTANCRCHLNYRLSGKKDEQDYAEV